jgi:hypothetical protein
MLDDLKSKKIAQANYKCQVCRRTTGTSLDLCGKESIKASILLHNNDDDHFVSLALRLWPICATTSAPATASFLLHPPLSLSTGPGLAHIWRPAASRPRPGNGHPEITWGYQGDSGQYQLEPTASTVVWEYQFDPEDAFPWGIHSDI